MYGKPAVAMRDSGSSDAIARHYSRKFLMVLTLLSNAELTWGESAI
jgi:hypothetical protein